MKVYVAGILPVHGEVILNEYLGNWNINKPKISKQFIPNIINAKKYILKKGTLQSAIRIGRAFVNPDNDYIKLKFFSVILTNTTSPLSSVIYFSPVTPPGGFLGSPYLP